MAKGPDAFRTISEAATELGLEQHVLRFWETRFSFNRPMKRSGGRRFYRPRDIAMLANVRRLLHDEGLSIKQVQARYRDHGWRELEFVQPERVTAGDAPAAVVDHDSRLRSALAALEASRSRLLATLRGTTTPVDRAARQGTPDEQAAR